MFFPNPSAQIHCIALNNEPPHRIPVARHCCTDNLENPLKDLKRQLKFLGFTHQKQVAKATVYFFSYKYFTDKWCTNQYLQLPKVHLNIKPI